ncbi:hypothetical protein WR25_17496 [Diploscapter pachys]|uniref:Helicase C-terminal domain-containing protein n=1 Tax=Diploscapter pachys TaxID=2018661 RepID=A0A2A2JD53_9BILA|nr:hypothetical protein WR25_17496 [Diploscapter pachys]
MIEYHSSAVASGHETRHKEQQKWMSGEIPVVVTPTIASGMGIDKADLSAIKNATRNGTEYDSSSASAI